MDWDYGRFGASQNERTLVLSRMEKKDCNIRIGMNGRMVKLGQDIVDVLQIQDSIEARVEGRQYYQGRTEQKMCKIRMECTEDMIGTRQNGRMVKFGQNIVGVLEDQERIEWKGDKTRKGQSRRMVGLGQDREKLWQD